MERVKMVLCGMAILSLLFAFGLPVAHAQDFEIEGQAQFKAKMYTHDVQLVQAKGKGYVAFVHNPFFDSDCDGLGFDYDVWFIDNPNAVGQDCDLYWLGYIDTCSGEASAVGFIAVEDPEGSGDTALCYFNGPVKNLKTFGSKGGECDLYNGGNWIGISKTAGFKIKQKDLTKKVKCTLELPPPSP